MTWAVLAAGLALTIFGAAAGTALVSLSRLELTRAVAGQLRGGKGSLSWLAEMERYLGVTATLTALGVIVVGAAIPAFLAGFTLPALALLLVLVVMPLVLLAGYLIPRWLVRPRAEALRNLMVPILRPVARLVEVVLPIRMAPGSDLRAFWREGAAAGLAADEELIMIGGVMTFTERHVREVMTPRTDIVAVSEDDALEDIASVFAQSGYSRLPVYRGTLDEIVGMLHAFDLFKLQPGDRLPIRPVANAPASRTCGDLLLDMQRERRHLAVVLDEFGGTMGIVTLEDLLEELVGEIFDEFDVGTSQPGGSGPLLFEVDGSLPVSAIEERFEQALPSARTSTAGGLLAELAGRIPQAGERFLIRGLEFQVLQATPTRIERVIVRRGSAAPIVLAPPRSD